jgi:hypothetical protein
VEGGPWGDPNIGQEHLATPAHVGMHMGGHGINTYEHGCSSGASIGAGEATFLFLEEGPNYEWPLDGEMNVTNSKGLHNPRVSSVFRRRRTMIVQRQVTQLSGRSESEISDYEIGEEDESNPEVVELNGVKHVYKDETWSQNFFTYDPKPKEFTGRSCTSRVFPHLPSILQLWELFWPFNLLRKIVVETNRYASHPLDALGNTMGAKNG